MRRPARVLVVACGALVREVRAVLAQLPDIDVDVEYLPANLHNRPERITGAVCARARRRGRPGYDPMAVAYGDCGTGGHLDAALAERGVSRTGAGRTATRSWPGAPVFAELQEAELGTFYLTDYLARHFDALVIGGLGLDRHPELRDAYFGNYRRVVHLAQTDSPSCRRRSRAAAARLGLAYERRLVGLAPFASALAAGLRAASRHDPHRAVLRHPRGGDRLRPPLRHDRRAHQPDRPQAAGRGDEGRRLQPRRGRRRGPGGGRRAHARRQRRHPPGRRAGAPRPGRASSSRSWSTSRCRSTRRSSRRSRPGLAVYQGKPLVNSVTGEDEVMERVLPLVAKYGAAVVAISNDETGISEDPDVRFEVAKRIVNRAADHGIPTSDIVVDPLVMPIGAMGTAGQQVFRLVRRLRDELGVNTTCGASNVSFGLPSRHHITGTFLAMAIGAGMTSAIMNPLHPEVKQMIMAADVLAGHDEHCAAWIRANRDPGAERRRGVGGRPPARRPGGPAGGARPHDHALSRPSPDDVSFELIPLKNLEAQLADAADRREGVRDLLADEGRGRHHGGGARLQDLGLVGHPAHRRSHGARPCPPRRARRAVPGGGADGVVRGGGRCREPGWLLRRRPDAAARPPRAPPRPGGRRRAGLPRRAQLHRPLQPWPPALHEKQAVLADAGLAGWASTQLCFDPTVIRSWLQRRASRGLALPVRLGLSAPVERTKLLALGMRVGVGQSLRYLKKNGRGLKGLLRGDGYDPDVLLDALQPDLEALGVTGVHLFTFNQLGAAVDWQRSLAA